MKFKCYKDLWYEDVKVMSEGDIILISNDYTQFYNLTRQTSIRNIDFDTMLPNIINKMNEDEYCENKCCGDEFCENIPPFKKITDKMYSTYLKKNEDYGDSFNQSLYKWGLSVAAIRLGDKLNRFESFVRKGSFAVNDEGVRDTLMDLATYSIMTIMYLDGNS